MVLMLAVGVGVAGTVRSSARQTTSTAPVVAVGPVGPFIPAPETHDHFSPLAFDALQAFERAYPAVVGSPPAQFAAASPYWAFQGVAYRGSQVVGTPWTTFGPLTANAGTHNISGRVSALAIDPNCTVAGPCRLWVGTAGGGVWRSDDAMNTTDVGWRWVSQGLGTNNIGSLTVDPNDSSGYTIYVGTGETNTPQNSGAGTGLYKSIDGGDTWTRIPTMITDPVVQAAPIDFTLTRGISTVVIVPGKPQTMYVATSTAMLGMTAVRGGQSQTTGYPQPRPGLYQTTDGGSTWTLLWVPPLDPVIPPNPDAAVGQGDTMIGVRHVVLDPRHADIVYAAAWNNGIFRSAPSLEGGDGAFKMVYAIVGRQGFQDLPMFDLTVSKGHTRIYAYNGTLATATQGLYRLDNADVAASTLVQGDGAAAVNGPSWISLSSTNSSQPGFTSASICTSQCFYDLVVAVPPNEPDTVLVAGVANEIGSSTIRSTDAGRSFNNFSLDAQPTINVAHSDTRAIVFHPQNPDIAFVGSDGGVVRNDGGFTNSTGTCSQFTTPPPQCQVAFANVPTQLFFLNAGLQTLQFYNIAVDPNAPLTRMLGGLQDNSTIWIDGTTQPARLEDRLRQRRRHVGLGLPPDQPVDPVRELPEHELLHELPQWPQHPVGADERSDLEQQRAGDDYGVDRTSVHHVRSGESGHAVHGLPAHLAHEGQRRASGDARSQLQRESRDERHVRRLDSARRDVSICQWLDAGRRQPAAGRSHEYDFRLRPRGWHHRVGRAHAGRQRNALGRDELRPTVHFEERRRRVRLRRDVSAHRHARRAQSLRHAHRRRSHRREHRVHRVLRLQRADAVNGWARVQGRLQPDDRPGVVHAVGQGPWRPADQHAGCRRCPRRYLCRDRLRPARAVEWRVVLAVGGCRLP